MLIINTRKTLQSEPISQVRAGNVFQWGQDFYLRAENGNNVFSVRLRDGLVANIPESSIVSIMPHTLTIED